MEMGCISLLLFLGSVCLFVCLSVQGQVAPECSYKRESYNPDIWISTPPLLIQDTSITVYFCSDSDFFNRAYRTTGLGRMRAAITEASISSTWNYTDYLISCYRHDCREYYQQNITNYLVTHRIFSSLQPNTLYSLEFMGCLRGFYYYDSCTPGDSLFSYRVNITTRPEAPQFWWWTTAEVIHIHFQVGYFTGPAPDGHEVLVWQKNGASHSTTTTLSHYFPVSTLNATVEGLLPSTEYFLYVRANGTHFANNQGSWVGREVKTRPLEPGVPTVTATVSRDTAVIVKLTPAQTFDLIEHCLVSIHPTTGSGATSGTEAVVEVSGNVLFIEGLLPGTEYSFQVAAMNEAGRSNFFEWVSFTTTATVESVVTGSSITLLWATPHSLDDEDIVSYVMSLSGVQDTEDVIKYTLPGSRRSAVLGGLRPGVTYQVQLMTETSSGLQPFYSVNVTTLDLQTSGGISQLVWSGAGAGMMLVTVLVVCCVPATVCCIVWRKRRNRKGKTDERPRPMATSNPKPYMQSEGCGVSGNDKDIEMDSNPAYTGVECFTDEDDVAWMQVRYHTQGEVGQLRRQRGIGEGRGRGGGEERGSGGGRGEASAGQGCDETEVGRRQGPVYANTIRS